MTKDNQLFSREASSSYVAKLLLNCQIHDTNGLIGLLKFFSRLFDLLEASANR
jgi:hypothetical protein